MRERSAASPQAWAAGKKWGGDCYQGLGVICKGKWCVSSSALNGSGSEAQRATRQAAGLLLGLSGFQVGDSVK